MMIYARNTDTGEHRIASSKNHTAAALGCYLNSDEVLIEASRDGWISFSGQESPINRDAVCDIQFSFNDCEKRYKVPMSRAFDWGKVKAYRPVFESGKVSTDATTETPPPVPGCFPPVGADCYAITETGYLKVRIVAHDGKWCIFKINDTRHDNYRWSEFPESFKCGLLPCPFCGCAEYLELEYLYEHCCRVICNAANGGCGATGGGGELSEGAEDQWNTRAH